MTDFQFCKSCRVPRFVEGFAYQEEYLDAGWVKEVFKRHSKTGVLFERIEWLCPDCRQAELADERDREAARQQMIQKSKENDPALYEKTMKERAS